MITLLYILLCSGFYLHEELCQDLSNKLRGECVCETKWHNGHVALKAVCEVDGKKVYVEQLIKRSY